MTIQTEVVIVGAGPCGLFQVFELGLLGIKCHLLDSLPGPGGQCAELYPEKPIYDIPALPVCGAQELVDRLMEQIKPFGATMHFGHEVTEVKKREDGRFDVVTGPGLRFDAGAVIIAGGVGSFQPRRLGVEGQEAFENTQIFYRVKAAAEFHGSDLVIFGGGDSALDWTVALADKALAGAGASSCGIPRGTGHRGEDAGTGGRGPHALHRGHGTVAAVQWRKAHRRRGQGRRGPDA